MIDAHHTQRERQLAERSSPFFLIDRRSKKHSDLEQCGWRNPAHFHCLARRLRGAMAAWLKISGIITTFQYVVDRWIRNECCRYVRYQANLILDHGRKEWWTSHFVSITEARRRVQSAKTFEWKYQITYFLTTSWPCLHHGWEWCMETVFGRKKQTRKDTLCTFMLSFSQLHSSCLSTRSCILAWKASLGPAHAFVLLSFLLRPSREAFSILVSFNITLPPQ